jgi:ResB-like family
MKDPVRPSSRLPDALEQRATEARPPKKSPPPAIVALKAFASLRLTVILFSLAMVLVFFGTLAQMNEGIWTVVDKYFRSWVVWIPLQLLVQFGQVFFSFPADWKLSGAVAFPFPAGWLLGWLMFINLVSAHFTRFRLTWKRSGVLILHSGFLLLLLGEWFTGIYAVEGTMTIVQGESSNYVQSTRQAELAVVTPKDDKNDDVVVVPGSLLRRAVKGQPVSHPDLPFDIRVEEYYVNSSPPRPFKDDEKPLADRGDGLKETVSALPEVSGTDKDQKIDTPAAVLTLLKKGTTESLGTWLVSWFYQNRPPKVTVDGKTYEVALRLKRTYKPYTLFLHKFEHKVYPGTKTPKDFASDVQLMDPSRGEDRRIRIWMNHPLYYSGETFYQSSFLQGDSGTVLQVVHNPAKWLPYISCGMITGGMTIHMLILLIGFLRKHRIQGS